MSTLAQRITVGGQAIEGPLKDINNLGDLINKIASFVIPLAAIVLFFVLVWGGYDFLLSRGNAEKIKTARAKLTAGIVGFLLLIMSYLIVNLVSYMFGIGGGLFGR
jgi:TRAP-type C4-dicarboxylate transport system permease small subunit